MTGPFRLPLGVFRCVAHSTSYEADAAARSQGIMGLAILVPGSQPSIEERRQRDGAVARNVVRGVDQGDPPAPGSGEERLPGRAMRAQLGEVPPPELRPLLRVVAEPLP